MYFGPDGHGTDQHKAKNIFDVKTNKAKNDLIINLINDIYDQIKIYHLMRKQLNDSNKALARCSQCENEQSKKQYFCEANEYGDKFLEKDCLTSKEEIYKQKEESENIINELQKNLMNLSEALRIYLKIEWNCAKNRDKC